MSIRTYLVLAAVGASVGGISTLASKVLAQSRASQPFTAAQLVLVEDGNGKVIIRQTGVFAQTESGVTVETKDFVNNQKAGSKVIVDPGAKRRFVIDALTDSITTYALSAAELARISDAATACEHSAERDIVHGIEVFRQETSRRAGNKSTKIESWVAPSLGCHPLRRVGITVEDGLVRSKTTLETTGLSLGTPAAELFRIPAGLQERTPSQVFEELSRRQGRECSECEIKSGEVLDRAQRKPEEP